MNKVALALSAASLLSAPGVAAQSPPPVIAAPSPLPPGLAPPRTELVTWTVGPILCAGRPVVPALAPRPLASAGLTFAGAPGGRPVRLDFSVDEAGRPLDIKAAAGSTDLGDLGPSLAASRFPAGGPQRGCAVWFTPTRTSFAQADPEAVMGFTVFPIGRPPRAAWDRVKPADTTCFEPQPQALNRAFPDFRKIPQPPGTLAWTMVGFDIDASGAPARVRRVAGTGNAVLDREAVVAVERSRFEEGARRACLFPYWKRGDDLVAPDAPDPAALKPQGATCPTTSEWARPPVYAFPDNYRRRHVEGWAVVAYDVAPWGEIGNARVLAAQPAAAFGDQALRVLRGAAKKPSSGGYTGCVDRVRFVVGERPGDGKGGPRIDVTPPEGE